MPRVKKRPTWKTSFKPWTHGGGHCGISVQGNTYEIEPVKIDGVRLHRVSLSTGEFSSSTWRVARSTIRSTSARRRKLAMPSSGTSIGSRARRTDRTA